MSKVRTDPIFHSQSQNFQQVYSQIYNSNTVYTFQQITETKSFGDQFDPKTNTIYWDPYSAHATGLGGQQSPALALAHEIDHAAFDDLYGWLSDLLFGIGYHYLEEDRDIITFEDPLAQELGEPMRFDHKYHGRTHVDDPTAGVRPNDPSPTGPPNWGAAGFPVPTGGVLGPGGIAALGPDAVFGGTLPGGFSPFWGGGFYNIGGAGEPGESPKDL